MDAMTQQPQPAGRLSDRTLLIVDDETNLRNQLAKAMERRGFTVSIAAGVADGCAQATAAPPAFAVVDLRQPRLPARRRRARGGQAPMGG